MNNYFSATAPTVRDKVESTLLEEIAIGNYMLTETKPTIVSALGAVLKADSDEIHLIHDCSQPEGYAINDYADIDSFKYQSIDDTVKLLKPGYYMVKWISGHAYRGVNIHLSNYAATGLKWQFSNSNKVTYLFDTRLSYQGRLAQGIFTGSHRQFMAKREYHALVVYLADFLVIGSTYAECLEVFNCLIELLQELGFQISWHEVVPPNFS